MKMPKIEQKQKSLKPYFNQKMTYIDVPYDSYAELKEDFKMAEHLAEIDELKIQGVHGVYLSVPTEEEGLKAAAYLNKKFSLHGSSKQYDTRRKRSSESSLSPISSSKCN